MSALLLVMKAIIYECALSEKWNYSIPGTTRVVYFTMFISKRMTSHFLQSRLHLRDIFPSAVTTI